MHLDTRLIEFRRDYWQTLQLAHGWDCNDLFNQSVKELMGDLKTLISSGTVTREQVSFLAMMLRVLINSQEKWLLRESATIEAAGAVMQ